MGEVVKPQPVQRAVGPIESCTVVLAPRAHRIQGTLHENRCDLQYNKKFQYILLHTW
eukprot:COSAG02_NODE_44029_length_369_cov_1.177778_1_plen_56_part_10